MMNNKLLVVPIVLVVLILVAFMGYFWITELQWL